MAQSKTSTPAGPLEYAPLTREEVRSVIDGRSTASRIPVILDFWVHPETFGDREPVVRAIMARYPQDVQDIWIRMPDVHRAPETDPGYRWVPFDAPVQEQGTTALDAQVAITDWAQLDEVLARFPASRSTPWMNGSSPANTASTSPSGPDSTCSRPSPGARPGMCAGRSGS